MKTPHCIQQHLPTHYQLWIFLSLYTNNVEWRALGNLTQILSHVQPILYQGDSTEEKHIY